MNKVHWILYPKDPRQLEAELPQYVLLHYWSVFVYCWEMWGNSKDYIPSVADVHKYMLDRAENCPDRQAILIELCYAEIAKLMRMSGKLNKRGCVKLFMTATLLL